MLAKIQRLLTELYDLRPVADVERFVCDRELVVRVLQDSGFSGIEITRFDADVITPNVDLEEALEFVMRAGPVSRYLMNASAEQVVDARAELERVFREKGTALTGSSWLVRARA